MPSAPAIAAEAHTTGCLRSTRLWTALVAEELTDQPISHTGCTKVSALAAPELQRRWQMPIGAVPCDVSPKCTAHTATDRKAGSAASSVSIAQSHGPNLPSSGSATTRTSPIAPRRGAPSPLYGGAKRRPPLPVLRRKTAPHSLCGAAERRRGGEGLFDRSAAALRHWLLAWPVGLLRGWCSCSSCFGEGVKKKGR